MQEIRTRLAPSPTGLLHVGNARAGIFNFLFAKKSGGKFILRIEDTDQERSKPEYEEDAKAAMRWLGLNWDEFYRQSDRKEIYSRHIKKLLENGSAYVSKETEGNLKEVIRLKNPGKIIKFDDIIRGNIETDTKDLGDFVIAKDEKTPLYHLAVVTDDYEMKISHIIRGEDHISNTPRQILIQEALRCPTPKYAHLPLILGSDRSKLSKRHPPVGEAGGADALSEYKKLGYLPDAMFNFLALLGWHPEDDREILSREELINEFSFDRVQKGGAIFDKRKLDWISREYIKKLDGEDFIEKLKPFIPEQWRNKNLPGAARLFQDRISKFSDFKEESKFIFELGDYDSELLIWKDASKEDTKKHLEKVYELIYSGGDVMACAKKEGMGEVLWPLRVSLSGQRNSPGPIEILEVLGKEESLRRIRHAISKL